MTKLSFKKLFTSLRKRDHQSNSSLLPEPVELGQDCNTESTIPQILITGRGQISSPKVSRLQAFTAKARNSTIKKLNRNKNTILDTRTQVVESNSVQEQFLPDIPRCSSFAHEESTIGLTSTTHAIEEQLNKKSTSIVMLDPKSTAQNVCGMPIMMRPRHTSASYLSSNHILNTANEAETGTSPAAKGEEEASIVTDACAEASCDPNTSSDSSFSCEQEQYGSSTEMASPVTEYTQTTHSRQGSKEIGTEHYFHDFSGIHCHHEVFVDKVGSHKESKNKETDVESEQIDQDESGPQTETEVLPSSNNDLVLFKTRSPSSEASDYNKLYESSETDEEVVISPQADLHPDLKTVQLGRALEKITEQLNDAVFERDTSMKLGEVLYQRYRELQNAHAEQCEISIDLRDSYVVVADQANDLQVQLDQQQKAYNELNEYTNKLQTVGLDIAQQLQNATARSSRIRELEQINDALQAQLESSNNDFEAARLQNERYAAIENEAKLLRDEVSQLNFEKAQLQADAQATARADARQKSNRVFDSLFSKVEGQNN